MTDRLDPIRLCCGQPSSWHVGVLCPDGKVMCQLCFNRFDVEELHVDEDGARHDVCAPCQAIDDTQVQARNKLLYGK